MIQKTKDKLLYLLEELRFRHEMEYWADDGSYSLAVIILVCMVLSQVLPLILMGKFLSIASTLSAISACCVVIYRKLTDFYKK